MSRTLQQSSQDALPTRPPMLSKAARLPRWRKCLAILALLCAVGLYSDAVTHHHHTPAQAFGCPVCHVVGHNALTVFTPSLAPASQATSWFRSSLSGIEIAALQQSVNPAHRSRAPPFLAPLFV